jgi:hypothetical protein
VDVDNRPPAVGEVVGAFDDGGMSEVWTVRVLTASAENAEAVAGGAAPTGAGAWAAAGEAVVAAATRYGRCEIWVRVRESDVLVIPGLDDDHAVDVADLRDGLDQLTRDITSATGPR